MKDRVIKIRTCVGCREEKDRDDLVRVVAGPDGSVVIDYAGKLPGRGAYICPRPSCVKEAFTRKGLTRALEGLDAGPLDDFINRLKERVLDRLTSILALSRKAGAAVDGMEAVGQAMEKGELRLLLMAGDLSDRTARELSAYCVRKGIRHHSILTMEKLGTTIGKDERGVIGIKDRSFSDRLDREIIRYKELLGEGSGGEKDV